MWTLLLVFFLLCIEPRSEPPTSWCLQIHADHHALSLFFSTFNCNSDVSSKIATIQNFVSFRNNRVPKFLVFGKLVPAAKKSRSGRSNRWQPKNLESRVPRIESCSERTQTESWPRWPLYKIPAPKLLKSLPGELVIATSVLKIFASLHQEWFEGKAFEFLPFLAFNSFAVGRFQWLRARP